MFSALSLSLLVWVLVVFVGHCCEACRHMLVPKRHDGSDIRCKNHLVFARSYLICHFGGVARHRNSLAFQENPTIPQYIRNSKSYVEEAPYRPTVSFPPWPWFGPILHRVSAIPSLLSTPSACIWDLAPQFLKMEQIFQIATWKVKHSRHDSSNFRWLQKPTHHSINTIHATRHGWSQNYIEPPILSSKSYRSSDTWGRVFRSGILPWKPLSTPHLALTLHLLSVGCVHESWSWDRGTTNRKDPTKVEICNLGSCLCTI